MIKKSHLKYKSLVKIILLLASRQTQQRTLVGIQIERLHNPMPTLPFGNARERASSFPCYGWLGNKEHL
jgi:hypothetical protein